MAQLNSLKLDRKIVVQQDRMGSRVSFMDKFPGSVKVNADPPFNY